MTPTIKIQASSLVLEVTRRCNMACAHCLRGNAQAVDISPLVLKFAAENISCSEITFSGGEPSLNVDAIRDYFELAEEANNLPSSFYVVTNGKANQRELAITLLDAFPKMDDPEMCGLAISQDRFHDDVDGTEIFNGLSFYRPESHRHDYGESDDWVQVKGLAEINGIDGRNTYNDKDTNIEFWRDAAGNVYAKIETLYIAANGNVRFNCDYTYWQIDNGRSCTVDTLADFLYKKFCYQQTKLFL